MVVYDIDPHNPALAGHMATASGRIIDLFNPNPDDILLSDIAEGLAYNFRWNGHARGYTVAEHCIRCHDQAPEDLKLLALFHDCEEAYWGDMIRPIKMLLGEHCPKLLAHMKATRMVILDKYNIKWDERIKEIDNAELRWDFESLILSKKYVPMKPEQAREIWLDRAWDLIPDLFPIDFWCNAM